MNRAFWIGLQNLTPVNALKYCFHIPLTRITIIFKHRYDDKNNEHGRHILLIFPDNAVCVPELLNEGEDIAFTKVSLPLMMPQKK